METIAARHMLEKMLTKNIIGAKHTSIDNVVKSLPKHLRGDAEKVLKQLRIIGYVTFHPTSYGMEVSINPTKLGEIKKTLGLP